MITSAPSETVAGRGPMRVCHVAYTFYENDNRVMRYAEALAGRGDHVDVIALRREGVPRQGVLRKVRVLRIQRRTLTERAPWVYLLKLLWFLTKSAFVLTALHIRRPYDVVHVHNVPDFLVFAALVPKLMGARVILDVHDIVPELYAGKFGTTRKSAAFRALLVVERLSGRFADHVLVANDLWRDRLVARSVPAAKCTTILNYPDLTTFKPRSARRSADAPFVVLYPGTLNRHQGLGFAIRAFAQVMDRVPKAELHIYGDGPARAELITLTKELNVGDRVKILDRLPLDQISQVIASAQVGIEPKLAEGFANEALSTKIFEFMACGVPVVVSRTLVHTHYFDDSLVRFFDAGSAAALGEALEDIYYGRIDLPAWIARGREFAMRNSWQERVSDYRNIIDSLAGSASNAQHASSAHVAPQR